jgi:putative glutamine amidotransferase
MEKLIRVLSIIILVVSFSWAKAPCENEKIIIGCTYDCGSFNEWRLKSSAQFLSYSVEFKDLRSFSSIEEGIKVVDAILIPGGEDIHPDLYNQASLPLIYREKINQFQSYYQPSQEGLKRDEFEFKFLKNFLDMGSNKPLLAICRGMQMLGVVHGIPLYQDIKAELNIRNRYQVFDEINLTNDSLIFSLFGTHTISGYEYHHQGLRADYFNEFKNELYPLVITGISHDGKIIEVIERKDRRILGVQFHPELSKPIVKHTIFKWLLEQACEAKRKIK